MEKKQTGPLLIPPSVSFTVATPGASPVTPTRERSPSEHPSAVLQPSTPNRAYSDPTSRGKRKAEHVEGGHTPPRDAKATGSLDPRPTLHTSPSAASSTAPSSFKRAKIADSEPSPPRPGSRSGSVSAHTGSPTTSTRHPSRTPSRMSQTSLAFPISALVAPRAPSVVSTHTAFHMRDPRKAPRIRPTGWGPGHDVHAWLFFVGFVVFPVWWAAGFCVPVPRTRRFDVEEKAQVWLDDPQIEFDAKSWRKRCRIMAGVSVVTYLPFIILLAVFLSRR
ncbi:hypothetical protein C8R46DRAFT_331839 [Mycena filopes]|nr:hypothetical protein C8R46DRAFT_331839 [Mycena filopes]